MPSTGLFEKLQRRIARESKRIGLVLQALSKVYRYGGYTTVNFSQVQQGQALAEKRILITGGSSGIGLAIAKRCIDEGARVVITGRSSEKLAKAAESLASPAVKALRWDIGDVESHAEKLSQAYSLLGGRLDILVNNAGILLGGDFPNVTESAWDETYRTNSKGLFFITQKVCSDWIESNSLITRKVLNISSQGGFVGATYPYRMSKWDVAGLTQGLGIKLARYGILVNGIAPGVVGTNMQSACLRQRDNVFYPDNPVERFALPEEIAELAVFMLSNSANFLVGQTIVCDGGFSIK